ncbi:hypothetical protein BOX15_Mlig009903g2 [Macrostomum lignano]|uniref:Uncharacterized protein n=1 Tax=Macrostomum lignano TaxID=282301 RepID=A0A267GZ83_9PLAT|nr:hypothetical protein BOX15_Mlig009903g1 [Macrostomum lignano]PAA91343.1 hypothetical protein BOX15_Mlig009903g2 [Macrostomum lignano]
MRAITQLLLVSCLVLIAAAGLSEACLAPILGAVGGKLHKIIAKKIKYVIKG